MDIEILELEMFLPYRLNRLADAVSREFSKIYRDRYGLTRPEWRTLAGLGQHRHHDGDSHRRAIRHAQDQGFAGGRRARKAQMAGPRDRRRPTAGLNT